MCESYEAEQERQERTSEDMADAKMHEGATMKSTIIDVNGRSIESEPECEPQAKVGRDNAIQKAEPQALAQVTPNQLLAMAVQANADPERLDKLMDLQLKWEANEARKAFSNAMAEFRTKCPAIAKTKRVAFEAKNGGASTDYTHAGLSESLEQIKVAMSECGLSHSWRTSQADGLVGVRCIVTHSMGHSEETSLQAPPDATGKKNLIQQVASTVTYLQRYTLFAILGLASQDQDDDGAGATPKQEPETPETPAPTDAEEKILVEIYQTIMDDNTPDGMNLCRPLLDQWLWSCKKSYPTADVVPKVVAFVRSKVTAGTPLSIYEPVEG